MKGGYSKSLALVLIGIVFAVGIVSYFTIVVKRQLN